VTRQHGGRGGCSGQVRFMETGPLAQLGPEAHRQKLYRHGYCTVAGRRRRGCRRNSLGAFSRLKNARKGVGGRHAWMPGSLTQV